MNYEATRKSSPIVGVSEETIEKAYRALRYNDANQDLLFSERALLPDIPGELSLISQQTGDRYSISFLLKSTKVNTHSDEIKAQIFLKENGFHIEKI